MAALTFSTAKTMISDVIGESDASFLTAIGTWLDQAQRDINRAHPWPSMLKRGWVNTQQVYRTGTVAVTTNTATVTGSGTVFPSDVATEPYTRFAPSLTAPWNLVTTRGGDTSLTLTEAYQGTTLAAGSSYVLYRVDLPLPTDVEVVERIYLHDHNDGEVVELPNIGPEFLGRWGHLPETEDRPCAFTDALPPMSTGQRLIRIGPSMSDDVYRLEILYRKMVTDGSASLPQELEEAWILKATAYAYQRDSFDKYVATLRLYEEAVDRAWQRTRLYAEESFSYGSERLRGHRDDEYGFRLNLDSLEI